MTSSGPDSRDRHLWIVLLAVAVLVGCVGWWANLQIGGAIRQDLQDELQSTLQANVTALEIWMANQKRIATSLTEEPTLKATTMDVLRIAEDADRSDSADEELRRLLRQLDDQLRSHLRALDYRLAQVVTTNFQSVGVGFASGRGRSRIAVPVPEETRSRFGVLFDLGTPVIVTPFKLRRGRDPRGPRPGRFETPPPPPRLSAEGGAPSRREGRWGPGLRPWMERLQEIIVMQVAAPVVDEDGRIRGALTLVIDPDTEFTRILSVARPGYSGESFAFDPEGVMISRSRFDPRLRELGLIDPATNSTSALSLSLRDPGGDLTEGHELSADMATLPLIALVSRALEGTSGVLLEPFRDYRGVPTVGAWRWLPNYGFGVATKIDGAEAYRLLRVTRQVFLVLFLLLVVAAGVIFLFSYMQLVWRRRVTAAELKVRQFGQYKLEHQIGEGGMGVVYKAHHALLRRETALKLLLPDRADGEAVRRFEREVRLTCQLTHPNTIQVYDYGHTPDGIFYYAMEYLDGLNLAQLVHQYGPQPAGRVIHILTQACASLSEAHALGLIHNDIKPANIFVCDRGGVPDTVKVLDFGLIRSFKDPGVNSTLQGEGVVGTPNYISPETLKDPERSDARSDLYSLGAVGYFLLTAQPVFEGTSLIEVCQKHLTEEPILPSERLGRPLCPRLEEAIMSCLRKQPSDRAQSAKQFSALLALSATEVEWTLEQRITWWRHQRLAKAEAPSVPSSLVPRPVEATVKIALADRTV